MEWDLNEYLNLLYEWKDANDRNDIEEMKRLGAKILEMEEKIESQRVEVK